MKLCHNCASFSLNMKQMFKGLLKVVHRLMRIIFFFSTEFGQEKTLKTKFLIMLTYGCKFMIFLQDLCQIVWLKGLGGSLGNSLNQILITIMVYGVTICGFVFA